MWFAGPCLSSAIFPTSKDLLPATKGTTHQRTPNTGPCFVPKVWTKTKTRFTQSSVRVSPYTEDGTAYDATRWFINFSIHALSSLSLFMVDPFFSGGIRTLKSLHWVSFQQVRTDVHARNPWFPPPGPSVPAGIFLHYLSCEKSNKILFLQTLEDFIISILPPIIGDLDSTRVVVEVFSKSTFITWQSCEVWYFCNEKVPTTPKFS